MRSNRYFSIIDGEDRGLGATLLRGGLRVASLPYAAAVAVRNALFSSGFRKIERVDVPVISIGNITVGGTGKTPCVEWVARFLSEQLGLAVCIVSRGYGAEKGPNDEAMVLEENLPDVPHLQDPDRVRGARTAVEELESEVIVLDDGFQHRRLHRDFDLVLLDASKPIQKEFLLPRGRLREPVQVLKSAHAILLTRCDQSPPDWPAHEQAAWLRKRFSAPVALARHVPTHWILGEGQEKEVSPGDIHEVAAFCGLGNPQAFRATLEQLGARVREFKTYPDHHPYSRTDVEELQRWAATLPVDCKVVTTQKDWVKLRLTELGQRQLMALRVQLQIHEGEAELVERLTAVVQAPRN